MNKLLNIEYQKYYNNITQLLSTFFRERNFIEVECQSHFSILSACEDPETISQFIFGGKNYPLPQTNQMNLEVILLTNPDLKGVFCHTTSYRDERFPIPGRHDLSFPMVEFEAHGNVLTLQHLLTDLVDFLHLSLHHKDNYLNYPRVVKYDEICKLYSTTSITEKEEALLQVDYGNNVLLTEFPRTSHPFWNMKSTADPNLFNKIDVIIRGIETIGSAERSCNTMEMRENFFSISNGKYAQLLFNAFTKEEVMKELDEYLHLPMVPRFGGGIGLTRLQRIMEET